MHIAAEHFCIYTVLLQHLGCLGGVRIGVTLKEFFSLTVALALSAQRRT